uniref:Putative acetyltransferase n=1 Tax=viral metagenome TaxID=1070528 RepID=A0A6M3JQ53_9ZZZZ
MDRTFTYDKLNHFDYFMFGPHFLIVACDKEDKIIGYIVITNGNELGKFYINPLHRATEVIHILRTEAAAWARHWGFKYIWGLCYGRMYLFYKRLKREYGLDIEFVESPEERGDGQWKVVANIEEDDEVNSRSSQL